MIPVFDYMQKPLIEACADTLLAPCRYLLGGRMVSCVRHVQRIEIEMYAKPVQFEWRWWKTAFAIMAFIPSALTGLCMQKLACLIYPLCSENHHTYSKKGAKPALKLLEGQDYIAVYATRNVYVEPILERIKNRYEDGIEIKAYLPDEKAPTNVQPYFVKGRAQSFFFGDGAFPTQDPQVMQYANMVLAGKADYVPSMTGGFPVETMLV